MTGSRSTYVRVLDPQWLRELRVQKGLSLRDVAMFTDRTHSYIAQIERGAKRTVSPATARRLHLLYGPQVKFSALFSLVDTAGRSAA